MNHLTDTCPICSVPLELRNGKAPCKPADRAQRWECANTYHVTGARYVERWNAGIAETSARGIGISEIANEDRQ